MHSLLIMLPKDFTHAYLQKWETALNRTFTSVQCRCIIHLPLKSSICTQVEESNFKILMEWYRTLTVLHKYYPSISNCCLSCQEEQGTLLHIFLSCPKLEHFWKEVHRIMQTFTNYILPEHPPFFLLYVLLHFQKNF